MRQSPERRRFIVLYLAPALVLFTIFFVIPAVRALGYSLQKWNGLSAPRWVGLANFSALLRDRELFLRALSHNLIITVLGGVLTLFAGLLFAAIVHQRTRGAGLFRVTFFFPNVLPSVVVALLWVLLYSPSEFGVINSLLAKLHAWGLPIPVDLPFAFTSPERLAFAVVPMMVWMSAGFFMVLFLAAMEGIPVSYYEAARLEGATNLQMFRHITLPLIRDVLAIGSVFLAIGGLKFFDPIWVMESGRPTVDSHVLATLLYQKVFIEYDIGYGSAVAVVLFILIFSATLILLRAQRREAIEY